MKYDVVCEVQIFGGGALLGADAGLPGTIVLSDSSGKALRKLKIPFVDGVAPHKSATKRGTFPLDKGSEEDHAFVKIPLKELQSEWIPSLYRYKDGTQQQGE